MKTDYEHIRFIKFADRPKTPAWTCVNKRSGDELGEVRWYPAWRQYCYFPTVQAVYSVGCLNDILNDINEFIGRLADNNK